VDRGVPICISQSELLTSKEPHVRRLAETSRIPKPWPKGRALLAALGLAATLMLATGASAAYGQPREQKRAPQPIELSVFSPGANDVAGKDGSGFVIDLALTARNKASNSLLSPEAGYKPLFNNPTSPTFQPGSNGGAPGLVVLLSTTPDTPGTPFHGPTTNLAGLFQINGVGAVRGGLTQTWNTWQIGKAGFGSGPSVLTAYVVKGVAPAVVPASGLEVLSNKVKVPFTITTPAASAPAAPAAANASLKIATDATLGDLLVDSSGRTLYLFEKDQGTTSACTGACLGTWPAYKPAGTATVAAGLDPTKLGIVNGQLTYAGHLLYSYAGDTKPGDTNGAAIPSWDAVSPTGAPLHAR
jgi:predicted lipoprotein with Yx(FWY)xxD motif